MIQSNPHCVVLVVRVLNAEVAYFWSRKKIILSIVKTETDM